MSQLIIDIVSLHQKPGTKRDIDLLVKRGDRGTKLFQELELAGAQIECVSVAAQLELESRSSQVNVNGELAIGWIAPCRRCLETTDGTQKCEVSEIFHISPIEGETYPLGEHELDLTPMVRETALLNLPLNPICDSECLGPEPDRFPTTTEQDPKNSGADTGDGDVDGGTEAPMDPRWGPLSELKFD